MQAIWDEEVQRSCDGCQSGRSKGEVAFRLPCLLGVVILDVSTVEPDHRESENKLEEAEG